MTQVANPTLTKLKKIRSVSYNSPACRRLDRELNNELSFDSHEECLTYVKTPVDCPLLGKTKEQEFDVRFDKDVLMRNL